MVIIKKGADAAVANEQSVCILHLHFEVRLDLLG